MPQQLGHTKQLIFSSYFGDVPLLAHRPRTQVSQERTYKPNSKHSNTAICLQSKTQPATRPRGAPNAPSSILPITPEPTHAHLPAEQRDTHKHTATEGIPSARCPQAGWSPRQLQTACAAPTSSKVPFPSSKHSPNAIQTSPSSSSSPAPTDSGGGSRLSS